MEFPQNYGFKYNKEYIEWQKAQFNGMFILWEDLDKIGTWELSFVDDDDYLHTLAKGDEDYIIVQLKVMDRDNKIDQILGQVKQN
jgi:hypothetical protein